MTLNPEIFDLKPQNHELVKLAYDAYLANSRSSHAKTLKRGEVRGGGRKPWKQKGTGRARFGSTRNPSWRHGGVAFGRTGEENFSKKLPKNSKKLAIRQALSLKHASKAIRLANIPFTGKTRDLSAELSKLKLQDKNTLLVVKEKSEQALRSSNNIPNLKLVRSQYLNVFDIMNADAIVFNDDALAASEAWLLGKENK